LNKKKIINDPVYGFISINNDLLFDVIQHPYFQRLRHIKQLGLTDFVYPGALHTRFHHALGALHLMGKALDNLRAKGIEISHDEYEATQLAILLHDIGHGPFSHALEHTFFPSIKHESLSYLFIKDLNEHFENRLELTQQIFRDSYSRKFFHQLVSSQLDIDRLDYLTRDSFFTGVKEGSISADRIISMLTVVNDQLVVEEKGIYSVENFLQARRLMFWQVYLHKTSISAERILVNLMKRAHYLLKAGEKLICTESLKLFLSQEFTIEHFVSDKALRSLYGELDDYDVWGAIKLWNHHPDFILSYLSTCLLQRNLFKISLSTDVIKKDQIERMRETICNKYNVLRTDSSFLFSVGSVTNEAYIAEGKTINILLKSGQMIDIAEASDLPNIKAISKIVKKNYACWPKNVSLN
jgi:uncharacterized protein